MVALVNFRGISESVKTNMVLTVVEVTGLVIIVLIGAWVLGSGDGDFGRNFEFKAGETALPAILAGTALAFYRSSGSRTRRTSPRRRAMPARSLSPSSPGSWSRASSTSS